MQHQSSIPFTEGAESILKVLEGKAFYSSRFLTQVKNLYSNTGGVKFPRLAPTLYLNSLFAKIPNDLRSSASTIAARRIVNNAKECPTPYEVRQIIAEAVLECYDLNFSTLYERAKDFLSFQPESKSIANRWIEKVIYTSIRKLTRERFIIAGPEEWRTTVSEVILSESIPLIAFEVIPGEKIPRSKHDYSGLLKKND